MPNVYQGPQSCYAKREGLYVRRVGKTGIDTLAEAAAIAYLILRDYRRGWTYDRESCRKIPMTEDLFKARLRGLIRYSSIHLKRLVKKRHIQASTAKTILSKIEQLAKYVMSSKRIPRDYYEKAKKLLIRV